MNNKGIIFIQTGVYGREIRYDLKTQVYTSEI